jgi:putative NADH-flavin reductase
LEEEGVHLVHGEVIDSAAVRATMHATDAAIVAIGTPLRKPGMAMSLATQTIVGAARHEGVGRLIVVSADGAGESHRGLPPLLRIGYFFIRQYMAEKARQERIVRESGLRWTIVRPTQLTDNPPTGRVATSRISGVRNQVSRADLAAFLVDQLDSAEFVGLTPGLFGLGPHSGSGVGGLTDGGRG